MCMHLRYEINPPKIIKNNNILNHNDIANLLKNTYNNISKITKNCNSIHITDSVLGSPRISPLTLTALLKNNYNSDIEITTSLRVRDRNIISITQYVYDSILLKTNGILFVNGDQPYLKSNDSYLTPSSVIKYFKQIGLINKMDLFLSIPNNPSFNKIQNKINAEPTGFITQVVNRVEQVSNIVDLLKPHGFKIIPCVLLPSINNLKSALKLNLDWSNYQYRILDFIKEICKMSDDIIITSPNDFNYANDVISSLPLDHKTKYSASG